MTHWVPPYFGSWEQLVNTLLHNPFLGSGHGGIHHTTHSDAEAARLSDLPPPRPWLPAVSYLLAAISTKVVAQDLPDGSDKISVINRANQTITEFINDICGTPWTWPPRAWPPPPPPSFNPFVDPPWAPWAVISELTLIANTLQPGALQLEVRSAARQMLQTLLTSTGVGNPGTTPAFPMNQ